MYDEGYYRYRESTRDFRIEAEILYKMLKLEPGLRILEVGCGGGAFLAYLEKKGYRAVGVDILEKSVELASQRAKSCEVICGDALKLPFESASFDRLVSHHLVEHLEDLSVALEEWKRVLKPGGVIAICTPNRLYPSPRIFEDPSHVHIYDRSELESVVEGAGLSVEDSLTIFPHLWRDRISVNIGVPLYRFFASMPYFRDRGRSLLLSARKNDGR